MFGAEFFYRVAAIVVVLQGLMTTGFAQTTETETRLSADLISVVKIWDQAPHNAFTDLIHWKGKFYCAFREGKGHAGDLGKLRVLVSVDGGKWDSASLIEDANFDLRDAALTEMPDGKLMVLGGAQIPGKSTGTFVCFSDDGVQFSDPEIVISPGRWLWRTTRQGDDSFGVAYGAPDRANASSLLKTRDGRIYETVVPDLLNDGEWPTEARIRFGVDATAYCLHRRDGKTKNTAMLGVSKAPYQEWQWKDLGQRLGGPNFIATPNGQWLAVGRLYDAPVRTELLQLDIEQGSMRSILKLPSGGDTSYPGMVWHDDFLWISYYSSHEGKASIYLAKVKVSDGISETNLEKRMPVSIGTRRELFVDDYLIENKRDVRFELHHPQSTESVLTFDQPWEGPFCGYVTVFKDDQKYRMYYRGLPNAGGDCSDQEVTCYAESENGIDWVKPALGLFEHSGSMANNIVLQGETPASHNFSPFFDQNPAVDSKHRYKALGGSADGLIAFVSPDGIHWSRLREEPVFTEGIFDSQNVPFWSAAENQYVCYFRTWTETNYGGFRTISRTTSDDFINWSAPKEMGFGEAPIEHLYTNQTHPYFRAPHQYIGIAARFMPGRQVLSPAEARRVGVDAGYFGDVSDAVLLTSRGGNQYQRTFLESLVRPGIGLENWVSRTNYSALGVVPTGESEMSIYIQKNYGQPTAHLQRYKLRTDGFASLASEYGGGEFTTRPLTFPKLTEQEIQAYRMKFADSSRPVIKVASDKLMFGKQAIQFRMPTSVSLPDTKSLGNAVTLAAHLRNVPAGHRRLFSSYNGGAPQKDELIFDINSGGDSDEQGSIRFFGGGVSCGASIAETGVWSLESGDRERHHVAVTWLDGLVKIYFDGKLVGQGGEAGRGSLELALGDLLFGEDYPPTSRENEPFLGLVDDIFVAKRALSPQEIARLANCGAATLICDGLHSDDLLLTMESNLENQLVNKANGSSLVLPVIKLEAKRELTLNMSTSAAGSVQVEIQDQRGNPVPGFTLAESDVLIGDSLDMVASWQGKTDLSPLAGQPFRFRFVMKDANLFSLKIQ